MQLIQSEYSADEYLEHMKGRFESPFSFGTERFCGFTGRKFFYVIHHCDREWDRGYRWDRRYRSPKNAAFGYVTASGDGCNVKFITFRGLFCPSQLLLTLLLAFIGEFLALWFGNNLQFLQDPLFWLLGLLMVAIGVPLHTLYESMTDRSQEGHEALLSFLYDPKYPFLR